VVGVDPEAEFEGVNASLRVIASEAKQSSARRQARQEKRFLGGALRARLDCFVVASLLLAMTRSGSPLSRAE
jgi:hypothetical protein